MCSLKLWLILIGLVYFRAKFVRILENVSDEMTPHWLVWTQKEWGSSKFIGILYFVFGMGSFKCIIYKIPRWITDDHFQKAKTGKSGSVSNITLCYNVQILIIQQRFIRLINKSEAGKCYNLWSNCLK